MPPKVGGGRGRDVGHGYQLCSVGDVADVECCQLVQSPDEVMLIYIFQFVDPARSPGCAKVNRFDHSGNSV